MSKQVELQVPDISCNHCAMHIKRGLSAVKGVHGVDVDVASKTVSLEYESDEDLKHAIAVLADIGYPVKSQD